MKKNLFLICLLIALHTVAQQSPDSLPAKKYSFDNDAYRHGKNLKTTSTVFLWTGLGLVTVGGLMMANNFAGNKEGSAGQNFNIGAGHCYRFVKLS